MRLPEFVTEVSPVRETLEAIARGEERLTADIEDVVRQFYVPTATRGLDLWEADYSLENQGEDAARRAAIWTALAGGRTLTPELLEELCVRLGQADWGQVNEDFLNWTVTAYSAAWGRIPEGAAALDAAIRRLKPAHLAVEAHPAGIFRTEMVRASALTGMELAETSGDDGVPAALARGAALTGGELAEISGLDALRGGAGRVLALTGGQCRMVSGDDALLSHAAPSRRGLTGCLTVEMTGTLWEMQ